MIIIDIETKENARAIEIGPSEKELSAPGNWKDKEKIKAREAENRVKWTDRLALDHRTNEIVGFTALDVNPGEVQLYTTIVADADSFTSKLDVVPALELCKEHDIGVEILRFADEAELLLFAWDEIRKDLSAGGFVSGFGIRRFDLPGLILRGAFAGFDSMPLTWENLNPYRTYHHTRVLDWESTLSAQNRLDLTGWNLGRYAEYFELKFRPFGKGEDYPAKYRASEFDWCFEHQIRDVLPILEFHERFSGAA